MPRFIKVTNRYGKHEPIFINTDNINYIKEIEADKDEDGNLLDPGTEFVMKDCVVYAQEKLEYILQKT